MKLGRIERSLGRKAQALDAFENALAIAPDDRDALYELGVEWLSGGEPGRAVEMLDRAAAVSPDDEEIAALAARARREARSGRTRPDDAS